jgi:hypothetical protein
MAYLTRGHDLSGLWWLEQPETLEIGRLAADRLSR